MAEYNTNLWAPWRMEYIRSLGPDLTEEGCFLCRYWETPSDDRAHHVVWRGQSAFVVMNRFPYTNGHLLVSAAAHKGHLDALTQSEWHEMNEMIRGAVTVLTDTLAPQGFNIGYNLGHGAGAGLPGHLHAHIVPRWNGDTNFMAVVADVRVIPDSLDALWTELTKTANTMGLRKD